MPKFANRPTNVRGPITTTDERVLTHERGVGFARDAKSDLFLLAATNMVSEHTFYEDAKSRDKRFEDLIHQVTAEDPGWVARFVPFLRTSMMMRSASIVMAAEYVRAGGPRGRRVIADACQRADEPGEMLAYWTSTYGRNIPQPVKRGVADAVGRLYTERNALRYDGNDRPWRFADVIELVHPAPNAPWQSALFKYLLDKRHHGDPVIEKANLPTLAADNELRYVHESNRRAALGTDLWNAAGWSWERLSGWLPGGMDAEAWQSVIPTMGVMALVRNLRNFDQATISEDAIDAVITKITDTDEVARARIFPYQVWSAYNAAPSDNWKRALGKTLDLTVQNVPRLDGGTLILVDTSSSMHGTVSGRSKMSRVEIAAVMSMVMAKRSHADVVIFGHTSARMPLDRAASTLAGVEAIVQSVGAVGHATYGHTALAQWWDPARHRRAIIVTDDQMHDAGSVDLSGVPSIFTFNLAGYAPSALPSGEHGRFALGGFNDAGFRLVPLLDRSGDGNWPF